MGKLSTKVLTALSLATVTLLLLAIMAGLARFIGWALFGL